MFKVIWIEEETNVALAERKGYLITAEDFTVDIAETLDSSISLIENTNYDVFVLDIRIPKDHEDLMDQHQTDISSHYNKHGVEFIEILRRKNLLQKLLIYTNESLDEIQETLNNYQIKRDQFLQKKDCRSNEMLESIIISLYIKTKL